ncbi:uncharacterized protein ACRADG_006098 [Cochliomyia hominivorax]
MFCEIKLGVLIVFFIINVDSNVGQESTEATDFSISEAFMRFARLRCLQEFPMADIANFSDTTETHCFMHCYLYKMGLMNLTTRGLNSEKFIGIWEHIEEAFLEDTCMDRFDFSEALNGTCFDSYRKLMEFRSNCLELFDYTFNTNSTWRSENPKFGKKVGQSATEYCDLIDEENITSKETSQNKEVSLLSQYQNKLKCIFENIHYLDAYGRVDEYEIILSYQEASEYSVQSEADIKTCCHRANSKYQQNNLGNAVLELQKCLKAQNASVYEKVLKLRDENSRTY